MKIAVTYENGQVFQHFGHTKQFKVYETADGKVVSSEIVGTQGQGHGALAGFLLGGGVDVLRDRRRRAGGTGRGGNPSFSRSKRRCRRTGGGVSCRQLNLRSGHRMQPSPWGRSA